MKIRKGFVSNSSSSSFVCDVCHHDESGWDLCLSEAEMSECVNGHVFCDSHADKDAWNFYDLPLDEKRTICVENAYGEDRKKELQEADEDEIDEYYSEEMEYDERYNVPAAACPCCSLTSPTDNQILEYMMWDKGCTKQDVLDEMRSRFTDYDEMSSEIKGK